jgi:ABC-2 type transport system ATP-binding protein
MKPVITAAALAKSFALAERGDGVRGALRTFFSRQHRIVHAVADLSFEVQPGEIVGLIGSNGAGKSTTIKMLTGILHPTSGHALVDGLVPHRDRRALARRIGVVFGQRSQLWWDLPLVESFRLLRWIYGVPRDRFQANLVRLSDALGINDFLKTPVRNLSLGQRMRGDLAAALLHDPPLLFLDEPTIGLDVEVRDTLLELVQRLNRDQGVSVVLTTHDLLNLEKVSHRILVIERGRLIFDDTLGALKNLFGPLRRVVVQFRDPIEERTLLAPGIPVRIAGDSATFEIDLNKMPIRDLLTIIDRSGHVIDVSISEPSIETIVKKLTGPVDRPQTQPDDG